MKALLKNTSILVRLTEAQRKSVERAARFVSRERGERVTATEVLREQGMAGVERILTASEQAAA